MGSADNAATAAHSREELSPEHVKLTERRSKREICLSVVIVVLFFIAVTFLVLFLVFYFEAKDKEDQPEEKKNICNTPECLQNAASISESLDQTVDPCDDFYQFACGKYPENNPIPLSLNYMSPFMRIELNKRDAMRDLLELQDPNAPEAIQKARNYYSSCIKTDVIDARGVEPLLALIRSGGAHLFPTLQGSSWQDENLSFTQILARVPRYPIFTDLFYKHLNPFITMLVQNDYLQSDKHIIYFTQAQFPSNGRSIFVGDRNSAILTLYEQLYTAIAQELGADSTVASQDAKEVVDLEVRVAQATSTKEVLRDHQKIYKKMTIQKLSERYPQFDWLEYLQQQFSPVGIDVTKEDEIGIEPLDYYDKIFPVISATSRRTLLNYCMWKFILGYADLVAGPVRKSKQIWDNLGVNRPAERWTMCLAQTEQLFPEALGRLYVDQHFNEHQRTKVDDMIGDLKDAFRDIVREADWMTDKTKQVAVEKVDAILDKVGYADVLKNDTYLNKKKENVVINVSTALENAVSAGTDLYRANLLKLRQPVDRRVWPVSVANVNAFYNPSTNAIVFPAAILQKPVYNKQILEVLTYGGLGFFIGHEITHGFDDSGADFDKDGNLRMWWQEEDLRQFESRAACMADQYSHYSFPQVNMSVNGKLTLGENIADNGALKEAYKAYKKMVAKTGKDPSLPVLGFTPDQLFFIGTAQLWCINSPDALLPAWLADEHSPNRFRVIGPMQNSEDFSRAFNCPVGSYMNPEKKCHVW